MKRLKFEIGKTGRTPVVVDAATLADTRLVLCANSGGGKSWAARKIVEGAGAGIPIIILDPEGEFSTLREELDMVLVGEDGDIDADPRSAALLCRKLVELRLSAVIDLFSLKFQQRRLFVRLFLEAMIDLPRSMWGPTLVVIDEAHKFCPEGGKAESADAVIGLMSQGRKRGYGGVLITQRLSKLNKDAVGEANNVAIGRCVQDVDIKRAGDLLGLSGASERNALRDLRPGEFHAFGPAFDFNGIVRFRTGKVKTTHPDAKTRHQLKPPAPSKAIADKLHEFENLPARAADEKATLEAARAEVRRLGAEIRRLKRAAPVPDKAQLEQAARLGAIQVGRSIRAVLEMKEAERLALADSLTEAVRTGLNALHVDLTGVLVGDEEIDLTAFSTDKVQVRQSRNGKLKGGVWSEGGTTHRVEVTGLTPSATKILSALAEYRDGLDKERLGIITGLATRGGSFNVTMRRLKDAGQVEVAGDMMKITDHGIETVGEPEPLPTGEELADHWRGKLANPSAVAIFNALKEHGDLDREQVGRFTGRATRGGAFNVAVRRLRAMQLVDVEGDMFKLNEHLREALAQ